MMLEATEGDGQILVTTSDMKIIVEDGFVQVYVRDGQHSVEVSSQRNEVLIDPEKSGWAISHPLPACEPEYLLVRFGDDGKVYGLHRSSTQTLPDPPVDASTN